jgi:hypothetical protein
VREVILVPRRDDDGPRDLLWHGYCRPFWEREHSHAPIVEGYHVDGLFNRSAAVNLAARLAGDWDVAIIIDSDVICDPNRVKEAVAIAAETGSMVLPHDERLDLSQSATARAVEGALDLFGPMPERDPMRHRIVHRAYNATNGHPSVSSVVVISRRQWDTIGGFDEKFRGWGYEDTAFAAAAETFGGVVRMTGVVWHLWHPTAKEGKRGTSTHSINSARGQAYRAAIGSPAAIRALQGTARTILTTAGGAIPRILHRTVPAKPDVVADGYWAAFEAMHPDWQLMTHRDPLDPADWPLTSPSWGKAANGAQLADLIRLEALLRWGGVYVDADVEPLRPLDSLLHLPAFAAWEDAKVVPNAVLGAVPDHPAIRECLEMMLERLPGPTWDAGPGVTTAVLPGRTDVLLLPPGSFYPYHYQEKHRAGENFRASQPWAFVVHHWAGSWLVKRPERPRRNSTSTIRRMVAIR